MGVNRPGIFVDSKLSNDSTFNDKSFPWVWTVIISHPIQLESTRNNQEAKTLLSVSVYDPGGTHDIFGRGVPL